MKHKILYKATGIDGKTYEGVPFKINGKWYMLLSNLDIGKSVLILLFMQ